MANEGDVPTASLAPDVPPTVHGAAARPPGERPGDSIGPYKLLEMLGEGGFGIVWLAEQSAPVKRRVALKVIKPGMDSAAVVGRFEAERQALALMEHPNVAKVFEAGTTPQGRPFFVMEYVPGVPITDHCDRQRLPLRARLDLFAQACDAVHHAHMKGIIHRDLKPGNILVAAKDETTAIVKIIDFGVAKATQMRLTEKSVFTEMGVLIGTPEYMSPEQAEMSAQDIDTRSDIYSLGIVLYELLVGEVPFDPKDLRRKGYAEIQRIIREVDPPRPSTRLTKATDATTGVANARRTRVGDLASVLRRELEWIPMKAMRKDRAERYRSAAEMADDVRNYLSGKPIIARGQAWTYLTRKFVRRHRFGIGAAALVALSLVAGMIATTYWAKEATRQRGEAEKRYQQVRKLAELYSDNQSVLADVEGATPARTVLAKSVLKALRDLQAGSDFDPLVADLLANSYSQLGEVLSELAGLNFGSNPELVRKILKSELDEGMPKNAIESFRSALELRQRLVDPAKQATSAALAHAQVDVASILSRTGDYKDADPLITQALATVDRLLASAGKDAKLLRLRAACLRAHGLSLQRANTAESMRRAGAEFRSALAARMDAANVDPESLATLRDLAAGHMDLAQWMAADNHFEEAADEYSTATNLCQRAIERDGTSGRSLWELARACRAAGRVRFNQALKLIGALRIDDRSRPEAWPVEVRTLLAASKPFLEEGARVSARLYENDPFSTLAFNQLVGAYEDMGDWFFSSRDPDAALAFFEAFLKKAEAAYTDDPLLLQRMRARALAWEKVGDAHKQLMEVLPAAQSKKRELDAASGAYETAAAGYAAALASHPESATSLRTASARVNSTHGQLLDDGRGDSERSIALYTAAVADYDALEKAGALNAVEKQKFTVLLRNLGFVMLDQRHDPAAAAKLLEHSVATMGPGELRRHKVLFSLGRAYAEGTPPDLEHAKATWRDALAAYKSLDPAKLNRDDPAILKDICEKLGISPDSVK